MRALFMLLTDSAVNCMIADGYSPNIRTYQIGWNTLNSLKVIRHQHGLTVKQLSVKSGLSPTAIYNFEAARHQLHTTTVEQLADALDVSTSDIELPRGSTHRGKPACSAGRSGGKPEPRPGECDCTQ
ncbi:MAG: XRE family transcriptional regulator [Chloroflexi bacterium]|nr:MAG: XRE family transcriptional regulator [Chloroflexota bacterium]